MPVRSILLAEDDKKLLRLYSDLLESDGFTVMQATDGANAVALLQKVPQPQLIILDVAMPQMGGIEACKRIRRIQASRPSPILFLSNMDTPVGILECLYAGGDDYLVKTTSLFELRARARYWTRRPSAEERSARRQRSIRALEAMINGIGAAEEKSPGAVLPQAAVTLEKPR